MAEKHIDEISGVETTGHEWDGIKELNNPLPRWWLYTFYGTILWAIAYTIAYPAWPLLTGSTQGVLGFHSRNVLKEEMTAATTAQKVFVDKIAAMPVADIEKDKDVSQFALNGGAAAFKVNCAPCHGSGATGGMGYPNLNDNDWLWGGKIGDIYTTIKHGIRADDPDTRTSEMPAFAEVIKPEQIKQVAAYVWSLSGHTPADPSMVALGKTVFGENGANCAACHGPEGKGNREFGAPNLTDAIWLKGEGEDAIIAQVTAPKHGLMPNWSKRLSDPTIKELAVYVHSLGGGE
jgi:cytochrome c oxidase cbb3-type subunit 3